MQRCVAVNFSTPICELISNKFDPVPFQQVRNSLQVVFARQVLSESNYERVLSKISTLLLRWEGACSTFQKALGLFQSWEINIALEFLPETFLASVLLFFDLPSSNRFFFSFQSAFLLSLKHQLEFVLYVEFNVFSFSFLSFLTKF